MAACDVLVNLRSPTMGETSGAVIRGLSLGKAMLVSRRRLVLGAARRRRAAGAGRRVRGGDDRRCARAGGRPQGRSSARRRASTSAREHDLGRAARRLRRALEEAAGGDAVSDAVLWRIAEAAAEVGLDDVTRAGGAGARGRAACGDMATRSRAVAEAALRRAGVALARARVPAWVWLAGIVVVSVAVRIALARRIVAPWIMIDEIVYSELAKSFASARAVPRPRRAEPRLRVRLPGADRAGVAALRRRARGLRGREGDQRGRDVARRDPGLLHRAAPVRARRSRSSPRC